MLKYLVNTVKFINYCFEWENPLLSFSAFMVKKSLFFFFEDWCIVLLMIDITYYCMEFSIVYVTLCTFINICMECNYRISSRFIRKTFFDVRRWSIKYYDLNLTTNLSNFIIFSSDSISSNSTSSHWRRYLGSWSNNESKKKTRYFYNFEEYYFVFVYLIGTKEIINGCYSWYSRYRSWNSRICWWSCFDIRTY